jgi:RsiW-degrading membrane proteinase PrsW (M82 family)
VLAVIVTGLTGNSNLVPTVILLGSFLVPVTFVAYAYEHEATRALDIQDILIAFVTGGILGVLGASILESAILPHTSIAIYLFVGLIEEGCKLAALWWIARRLEAYTMRDGIVLGAAVGFGFAAFESSGYAFNALFTRHGLSLGDLVQTEMLRGILAPFGHGLWTAIVGGALFASARNNRLRITRALVFWYIVAALLHALWDSSSGIAFWIVLLRTGSLQQWHDVQVGQPLNLSASQVGLFEVLSWGLLLVDAAIGLVLIRGRVKHAAREWAASSSPAGAGASA